VHGNHGFSIWRSIVRNSTRSQVSCTRPNATHAREPGRCLPKAASPSRRPCRPGVDEVDTTRDRLTSDILASSFGPRLPGYCATSRSGSRSRPRGSSSTWRNSACPWSRERPEPERPFARTLKRCVDCRWPSGVASTARSPAPSPSSRPAASSAAAGIAPGQARAAQHGRQPAPAAEASAATAASWRSASWTSGKIADDEQQLRRWRFHPALARVRRLGRRGASSPGCAPRLD